MAYPIEIGDGFKIATVPIGLVDPFKERRESFITRGDRGLKGEATKSIGEEGDGFRRKTFKYC